MRHPSTRAWRGTIIVCPLLWQRQQVIGISGESFEVLDFKRWDQALSRIEMYEASLPEINVPFTFKASMILDCDGMILNIGK